MLLLYDVDVDATTKDGYSALHIAAMYGCDAEIVELLLTEGADNTLKNNEGKTALDLAKTETIKDLLTQYETIAQLEEMVGSSTTEVDNDEHLAGIDHPESEVHEYE